MPAVLTQAVLTHHCRLFEAGDVALHKMPSGLFLVPAHQRAEARFRGSVQNRMQM